MLLTPICAQNSVKISSSTLFCCSRNFFIFPSRSAIRRSMVAVSGCQNKTNIVFFFLTFENPLSPETFFLPTAHQGTKVIGGGLRKAPLQNDVDMAYNIWTNGTQKPSMWHGWIVTIYGDQHWGLIFWCVSEILRKMQDPPKPPRISLE